MADGVSVSVQKCTTITIPSTRFSAISLERRTPLRISLLNAGAIDGGDRKRMTTAQCAQHTALKSRFGNSSSFLRGPANPNVRPFEGAIASSSWDDASSNGDDNNNINNNDENRSGLSPRDGFGLYPWDPSWQAMDLEELQWIQEETITLFTSEGVVKLGGSRMVTPRFSYNEKKYAQLRALSRLKRFREEDYMDPKQGLCLGAIFDIAATNGLDMGRRFCVFGFCRSIEMLSDVVEDTVLEQGGEVVIAEKGSTTGLHEKLTMTVAMPALWGVPPAFDVLNNAIRSGGGIVEKTYKKWEFF